MDELNAVFQLSYVAGIMCQHVAKHIVTALWLLVSNILFVQWHVLQLAWNLFDRISHRESLLCQKLCEF
jgi:hypothetical protein